MGFWGIDLTTLGEGAKMPWRPRELSESGLYHVTQRGNAHGIIFETDEDRRTFLRIVKRYQEELGFRVLAWCLMDDHVHIVLDIADADISSTMQHIEAAYVTYFNKRTRREGHLFQGPFRSKPIKTDAQLIATIHYVFRNPESAGICSMDTYHWSSFQECLGKRYLTDVDTVLEIFGGVEGIRLYQGDPSDIVHAEGGRRGMSDTEALALAQDLYGECVSNILRTGKREERDAVIRGLSANGVPERQIARLAGLGRHTVSQIISPS